MKIRSHTKQHNQIWAMGTEDTILSLIKGSYNVFGYIFLLEMVHYKKEKTCKYVWTRKREMTTLKQNS